MSGTISPLSCKTKKELLPVNTLAKNLQVPALTSKKEVIASKKEVSL